MQITTHPRPTAPTSWGRLLLLLAVLGPVSVLVLLPTGLGLQRYVVSGGSMDTGREGGIPRGALLLERHAALSELREGDVVTFVPPPGTSGPGPRALVTHRIVAIGPGGITTKGDAEPAADPWVLHPAGDTLPRVVTVVPWVGYGYLVLREPVTWVAAAGAALAGALLALTEAARRRRTTSAVPPPAVRTAVRPRVRGGGG